MAKRNLRRGLSQLLFLELKVLLFVWERLQEVTDLLE